MSEKTRVARNSAIAGLVMTLLKLAAGYLTGSLALVSEGIHSALDFFATLSTYIFVRAADKPADAEHQYGHGKLENLSAFAEALLLVVTAFLILKEAIHRLREPHPVATEHPFFWVAIAVVGASMAVDLWRGLALSRAAKKHRSQALEADALHFTIELGSSAIVLISLILLKQGGPGFQWADPAAAIVVSLVMGFVAVKLAKRAVDVLTDRAPQGVEARMEETIRRVPGVADVIRMRARQSGSDTFVDATITVDPQIGLQGGHDVASRVELAVTERYPGTDLTVHVEPAQSPHNDHAAAVRELAGADGLHIHALRVREIDGGLYVYFHLELPPDMTLAKAHDVVTQLERKIKLRLPKVAEVESHPEPEGAVHGE